jgi:hypothetical protein
MVHLERIYEEIRVLNIKDETLLSFRVFENFIKRRQHFDTIKMGFFPEDTELGHLTTYFKTLEELFPEISAKWHSRVR